MNNEESEKSILLEAHEIVHNDRGKQYGHPLDDHTCTAKIVTALLEREGLLAPGKSLQAEHISKIMIAVKLSRETHAAKRDNRVDGAGYFETLDMIITEREHRADLVPTYRARAINVNLCTHGDDPLYCEHPNEVPNKCPCDIDCYCHGRSCPGIYDGGC